MVWDYKWIWYCFNLLFPPLVHMLFKYQHEINKMWLECFNFCRWKYTKGTLAVWILCNVACLVLTKGKFFVIVASYYLSCLLLLPCSILDCYLVLTTSLLITVTITVRLFQCFREIISVWCTCTFHIDCTCNFHSHLMIYMYLSMCHW